MVAARVTSTLVALCLWCAMPAAAQAHVDPSGHWEGTIQVPDHEVMFELDLAKNDKGMLAGTFTSPNGTIKGLPLARIAVEGTSITFQVDRPDRPFTGVISADGKSIAGNITAEGRSVPFSLRRTGEAKIPATAASAPIGKELEGTWSGTMDVNGMQMHIVLKLANQSDGTSAGSISNLDQGGADIPIATITQKGTAVTLDVAIVAGTYAGTLNTDETELRGTWTQGPLNVPLTLRRSGMDLKK